MVCRWLELCDLNRIPKRTALMTWVEKLFGDAEERTEANSVKLWMFKVWKLEL